MKVLIPTKLNRIASDILKKNGYEVVQDQETALEELIKQHKDAEALLVRSEKVTPAIIDALPNLKLIVRAGSGYNTIDIQYARRQNVDVMNTPGANANAVAEEVFALALAHYRHVVRGDNTTRQGLWEKKKLMGRELYGKTLGILGLGNIGQLVAKRASGFEMKLLGYDPVITRHRAEEIGVELVDLKRLFSESDIVTMHIPETKETVGMINKYLLNLMKPEATLINCARAGILNEDDFRELKAEKEFGFCNDVYPEDAPGEKSVADIADIMLPHLGASTHEANINAARRAAEQLIAYFERGVTSFVVNKGVPDGLDEQYQHLAYHIALLARHYLGTGESIRRIECSFYGDLGQFSKWFVSPIVAGICTDFDSFQDPQGAEQYLKEKGIDFVVRSTDESKHYGNSMTIDMLEGGQQLREVSVRGTIAESIIMISRINNFEKLYFEPTGNNLFVVYLDRPGVLSKITGACADAGLNIEDIRAPLDRSARLALAILKLDKEIPADVVERIRQAVDAEVAFAMSIP